MHPIRMTRILACMVSLHGIHTRQHDTYVHKHESYSHGWPSHGTATKSSITQRLCHLKVDDNEKRGVSGRT
jgi:hypothetical protein